MSETYSNVDGSARVDEALQWQDRVDAWPQIQEYKRRAHELLGAARPVLDVGCGTGVDLAVLAPDAFGVDASLAMCTCSHDRGHTVARADIHALPFADATFAGVRADRVVQHVADPRRAIDELVRVSAGRVVVADPDQSTLEIVVPGAPTSLVDAVTRLRAQRGYRNGVFVREVIDLFDRRDYDDLTVDEFTLVLTDPDDAFGLPTWVDYWRSEGDFGDDDVAMWDGAMQRAREEGGFEFALQYVVIGATVSRS